MLPTVLLDLDVKGYCSIIGCVLKSEFYAALTGSHIMTPRIRTATGLKLIWDLPVVTGPPRHRSDTGWTRAKRTMTHTIICHSAVPWCHTGHRVLSAFYPTQSLNGNDMTLASCDATVSYAASRQAHFKISVRNVRANLCLTVPQTMNVATEHVQCTAAAGLGWWENRISSRLCQPIIRGKL